MKRRGKMAVCAGIMSLAMAVPSFAGAWQQNNAGWWYQQDDGSYPTNCWSWIDGNYDGIAECYYFNELGYCVTGLTPDGNYTDGNGAWTVNGVVQTRPVAPSTPAANTQTAAANPLLGTWTGSYNANQGETGVDITFFEDYGELKAEFVFYNLPGQINAESGSFISRVEKIGVDSYKLISEEWIDQPSGYSMISWKITVSNNRITGVATDNSSYKINLKK